MPYTPGFWVNVKSLYTLKTYASFIFYSTSRTGDNFSFVDKIIIQCFLYQ